MAPTSLRFRVLSVKKINGFGLYLLSQISTHRYAPLTFSPLLRVGRDNGDDDFDTTITT